MTEQRTQELLHIMRPPGDMADELVAFLKRYVPQNAMIAEIGCFAGASTELILQHCNKGHVYAIDMWDQSYFNGEWQMSEVEECFDRLIPKYKNLTKIKSSSLEAAKMFYWLDAVYIDAEHDYESVKADILAWSPLVKQYGVISGHDFLQPWPGVIQAVKELCTPFTVFKDSTWVTIKQ